MSDMINCIASKADTEEDPLNFGTYSVIDIMGSVFPSPVAKLKILRCVPISFIRSIACKGLEDKY